MRLSLTDKHVIVNYHYVEDPRENFSGIHPCSIEKFEKQIEWLTEHFAITTVERVYESAQKRLSEKYCAITFDDGLKGQYDNAVPILKKYGVTAVFFPITGTFEGFVPSTHKMHVLLSRYPAEELVEKSNLFFKTENLAQYIIPKDWRLTQERKLYDNILTANLKEIVNIVTQRIEKQLLDFLFTEYGIDEGALSRELFMTKRQIAELAQNGFLFGSHTHHHVALDTAESDGLIERELRVSKELLESLVKNPITLISYPHGIVINDGIIAILKKEGFTRGVSIEARTVQKGDSPFYIPRFDVNDVVV